VKIGRDRGVLPGGAAYQAVTGAVFALLVPDVQGGDVRNAAALRHAADASRSGVEVSMHDMWREACQMPSRERPVQEVRCAAGDDGEPDAAIRPFLSDGVVRGGDLAPESVGALRSPILDQHRDVVPGAGLSGRKLDAVTLASIELFAQDRMQDVHLAPQPAHAYYPCGALANRVNGEMRYRELRF